MPTFSAVHICDLSYIHLHSSPSPGILQTPNETSSQMDQFIDQLVEHCIGIAEVMGLNSFSSFHFTTA